MIFVNLVNSLYLTLSMLSSKVGINISAKSFEIGISYLVYYRSICLGYINNMVDQSICCGMIMVESLKTIVFILPIYHSLSAMQLKAILMPIIFMLMVNN